MPEVRKYQGHTVLAPKTSEEISIRRAYLIAVGDKQGQADLREFIGFGGRDISDRTQIPMGHPVELKR